MVAGLQSTAIFQQLREHLSSSPEIVKKVNAVYLWNITKDGKTVAKWSKSSASREVLDVGTLHRVGTEVQTTYML